MKRVWKNPSILNLGMPFESRMEKRLWKVQSRFYPGDLMTRTGDREIRSVSGRLPDNPGELACMMWAILFVTEKWFCDVSSNADTSRRNLALKQ